MVSDVLSTCHHHNALHNTLLLPVGLIASTCTQHRCKLIINISMLQMMSICLSIVNEYGCRSTFFLCNSQPWRDQVDVKIHRWLYQLVRLQWYHLYNPVIYLIMPEDIDSYFIILLLLKKDINSMQEIRTTSLVKRFLVHLFVHIDYFVPWWFINRDRAF